MWARLRSFVTALLRRERFEDTLSEELRFHLEAYTADLIEGGMSRKEAERQARLEFGSVMRVREDCRQASGLRFVDELRQNIRYALRLLLQKPGFTATAVLSLAIGIGANAAIFSVINALLIRDVPLKDPSRLVNVYLGPPDSPYRTFSYPDYDDLVAGSSEIFEGVLASRYAIGQTERDGSVATIMGELVTGNYFQLLGISAHIGRTLLPEDDVAPGAHPVVVLGYRYWQSRFGADPEVVGQSLRLAGRPFEIVGVAPANYPGNLPIISAFFAPRMMVNIIEGGSSDLLQSLIAAALDLARLEAEKANSINEFLREMLGSANPLKGTSREITVIEALGQAAAKLETSFGGQPEIRAALEDTIGSTYRDLGDFARAEPLLRSALEIRRSVLGEDHLDVAESLHSLGVILYRQGKYEETAQMYLRSLEIKEERLGPDHLSLASGLNNLANVRGQQRRYDEAAALLSRSLEIKEKVLGPDNTEISGTLNNLAVFYFDQGKYEKAVQLYLRSLEIAEKGFGSDHPLVGAILSNLGDLYVAQDSYTEAERLYRESLQILEEATGPSHYVVVYPLHGLGNLYRNQRRYADAEPFYRRVLDLRQKSLGRDEPDLVKLREDLAELLRETGREAEAEELLTFLGSSHGDS